MMPTHSPAPHFKWAAHQQTLNICQETINLAAPPIASAINQATKRPTKRWREKKQREVEHAGKHQVVASVI
jgi:hypothetical protein